MRRRRLLATLGTAVGLAGCSGPVGRSDRGTGGDEGEATTATTGRTGTPTERPSAADARRIPPPDELDLPIPESEFRRGAARDGIAAITEPAFGPDWEGIEVEFEDPRSGETDTYRPQLTDDDRVIGVDRAGERRAYPLKLLRWHEVVNDDLGGPLLVTYCPLCRSGLVAERTVNGEPTVFGVSGLLWHENLLLYDRATDSLWSQILATAIRGPETGETLGILPSTLTTWGEWREANPDTVVLLPSPRSVTVHGPLRINYAVNVYENRTELDAALDGSRQDADTRLPEYETVVGVRHDGTVRAYPLLVVEEEGVVNDAVGGLPVVVAAGPENTLVAYERRVDGETLSFAPDDDRHMTAAGSRWEITTGRAVDGPHEGARLANAAAASPMYWVSWLEFFPETELYGREG